MSGPRVTFRWMVAVAAGVAGVVVAVSLGNWQTRRAEGKLEIEAQWRAAEAAGPRSVGATSAASVPSKLPQRIRLQGQFLHDKSVWLDNRPLDGKAGLLLLTPLALADSAPERATVVLVMRGWAPRDPHDRSRLPAVSQMAGPVMVEGLAVAHPPRVYALGDAPEPGQLPALWQNLDFDQYAKASGLAVLPFVVQQEGRVEDGLVRDWPRPASGVDKHRGYAVQWYALAALIAVLTLVLGGRAMLRRTAA